MATPTASFAQLRAAPVQDGLRFSAADLEKMPLMGVGCQLQFRQVWLDIHEGALAQHPISQNEFLVLLATEASQQPSDTSQAVNMLLHQLVVVRVEDWEVIRPALPNGHTHVLRGDGASPPTDQRRRGNQHAHLQRAEPHLQQGKYGPCPQRARSAWCQTTQARACAKRNEMRRMRHQKTAVELWNEIRHAAWF